LTLSSTLTLVENKRSVLLVSNTSWYLFNFRRDLAFALRDAGFNVGFVAPYDQYTNILKADGFDFYDWRLNRKSLNPFKEIVSLYRLSTIYKSVRPDLVHHFTIKACLYGTLAAKSARVYRVVNAITGLGHVFLGSKKRNSVLRAFLKPIYRVVFMAKRTTMVFQNSDDQEELIKLGIADGSRARLIRGSGVDVSYFSRSMLPPSAYSDTSGNALKLLFPSRLIREKGTSELLQACESLWDQGLNVQLFIAGQVDQGNRSSLSPHEYSLLSSVASIHLLGHVEDMRSLYAAMDAVVLPSWREGLSRSLIEAAAMELAIITTDVPGCRDVVEHGISGLLVPKQDAQALALAIQLLYVNRSFLRSLGSKARQSVVSNFNVQIVNSDTLRAYSDIFKVPVPLEPGSVDLDSVFAA